MLRQLVGISCMLMLLVGLFSGCARFPSAGNVSPAPAQTIYSDIMLNSQGQINPSAYYFFALGVDQTSNSGPVPVTSGTEYTNGWGTLNNLPAGQVQQPPFFVEFNNGAFAEFVQNGATWQYLGAPYSCGTRFDGLNWHIYVEIDQSLLTKYGLIPAGTINPVVQANWITVASLTVPPAQAGLQKPYDGFGLSGNSYLTPISLNVPQTWTSGIGGAPAQPSDNEALTGSMTNGVYDPGYYLNIVWWTVSVKIYSQPAASPAIRLRPGQ